MYSPNRTERTDKLMNGYQTLNYWTQSSLFSNVIIVLRPPGTHDFRKSKTRLPEQKRKGKKVKKKKKNDSIKIETMDVLMQHPIILGITSKKVGIPSQKLHQECPPSPPSLT